MQCPCEDFDRFLSDHFSSDIPKRHRVNPADSAVDMGKSLFGN